MSSGPRTRSRSPICHPQRTSGYRGCHGQSTMKPLRSKPALGKAAKRRRRTAWRATLRNGHGDPATAPGAANPDTGRVPAADGGNRVALTRSCRADDLPGLAFHQVGLGAVRLGRVGSERLARLLVCHYALAFGLGPQWFDGLWQGWVAMAGGAEGQRIARRRRTAPGRC